MPSGLKRKKKEGDWTDGETSLEVGAEGFSGNVIYVCMWKRWGPKFLVFFSFMANQKCSRWLVLVTG